MQDDLASLVEELAEYAYDPYGFVLWAFPWGEPGTLAEQVGPEPWQKEILEALGSGVISVEGAVRLAVRSGHGIGKSALVAWIILWAFSTFPDTRGIVTANTENQLRTKTWVELAKWFYLFIAKDLFRMTNTALFARDPDHETTWRVDMVPWSERNTEAFAGMHNAGKRLFAIFDEASAIPDVIHEVMEGALTDANTEIIWFMAGNPTKNVGRFREAFEGGRFNRRWRTWKVDSREVSFTNKKQIAEWIDDYGEDHDFVRVRVKGEFPRHDAESFISRELAVEATTRELPPNNMAPLVLGVDVGRYGDDPSVIYPRRGRDARSWKPRMFYGLNTMQLAAQIHNTYIELDADFIFVDGGGVGGGVVDRLLELRLPVIEVQFGAAPDGTNLNPYEVKYRNKRAEIWGGARDFLKTGCITNDVIGSTSLEGTQMTLVDELIAPTFTYDDKDRILLESKKDLRRRGISSTNVADALATTFALPVENPRAGVFANESKPVVAKDYNPYAEESIYANS